MRSPLRPQATSGDIPHILFYGPSGAGKKTRISALLREMFGPAVEKVKCVTRPVKTKSKTIDVTTVQSNWHVELSPSDFGNSDLHVVQEVIKEIASAPSISVAIRHATEASNAAASSSSSSSSSAAAAAMSDGKDGGGKTQPPFKVVVLHDVDRLSLDAQHGLRRTMEQYMSTCRLILCCESACRVAAPLRSRCLMLRVPAPSDTEVVGALNAIARAEKFELPAVFAQKIAEEAGGNLRKAVLILESCKVDRYPFASDQSVRVADWLRFVEDIARLCTAEQSAQQLLLVRGKLYELLTNCVPADVIMRTLALLLLRGCDDQIRHEVVQWAAFYEHRMNTGSKPIFHLEAFVAKFMAVYKRWMVATFG